MPPKFPSAGRIELGKPPLQLVVCQVRFPPILELAAGHPPTKFQESVKDMYPVTHHDQTIEMRNVSGDSPILHPSHHWRFDDKDSQWTVTIGDTFLSLETTHYRQFSAFVERFDAVLKIASELFPIEIRDRVGLRYIDRLSQTLCPNLPENWRDSIHAELIPLRAWSGDDEQQKGQLETRYAYDDRFLVIRASMVDKGFLGASEDEFVLDIDCFSADRLPVGDLRVLLGKFKEESYNVFRWAVGDLVTHFDPVETE